MLRSKKPGRTARLQNGWPGLPPHTPSRGPPRHHCRASSRSCCCLPPCWRQAGAVEADRLLELLPLFEHKTSPGLSLVTPAVANAGLVAVEG